MHNISQKQLIQFSITNLFHLTHSLLAYAEKKFYPLYGLVSSSYLTKLMIGQQD